MPKRISRPEGYTPPSEAEIAAAAKEAKVENYDVDLVHDLCNYTKGGKPLPPQAYETWAREQAQKMMADPQFKHEPGLPREQVESEIAGRLIRQQRSVGDFISGIDLRWFPGETPAQKAMSLFKLVDEMNKAHRRNLNIDREKQPLGKSQADELFEQLRKADKLNSQERKLLRPGKGKQKSDSKPFKLDVGANKAQKGENQAEKPDPKNPEGTNGGAKQPEKKTDKTDAKEKSPEKAQKKEPAEPANPDKNAAKTATGKKDDAKPKSEDDKAGSNPKNDKKKQQPDKKDEQEKDDNKKESGASNGKGDKSDGDGDGDGDKAGSKSAADSDSQNSQSAEGEADGDGTASGAGSPGEGDSEASGQGDGDGAAGDGTPGGDSNSGGSGSPDDPAGDADDTPPGEEVDKSHEQPDPTIGGSGSGNQHKDLSALDVGEDSEDRYEFAKDLMPGGQMDTMLETSRHLDKFESLAITKRQGTKPDPNGEEVRRRLMKDISEVGRVVPTDLAWRNVNRTYWRYRLASHKNVVREKITRFARKQIIFILLDGSGSMGVARKHWRASGVVMNRLKAVISGDAELWLSVFDTRMAAVHHAATEQEALDLMERFMANNFTGGGTNIAASVKAAHAYIVQLMKTRSELERPELWVLTDEDMSISSLKAREVEGTKVNCMIFGASNRTLSKFVAETGGVAFENY